MRHVRRLQSRALTLGDRPSNTLSWTRDACTRSPSRARRLHVWSDLRLPTGRLSDVFVAAFVTLSSQFIIASECRVLPFVSVPQAYRCHQSAYWVTRLQWLTAYDLGSRHTLFGLATSFAVCSLELVWTSHQRLYM